MTLAVSSPKHRIVQIAPGVDKLLKLIGKVWVGLQQRRQHQYFAMRNASGLVQAHAEHFSVQQLGRAIDSGASVAHSVRLLFELVGQSLPAPHKITNARGLLGKLQHNAKEDGDLAPQQRQGLFWLHQVKRHLLISRQRLAGQDYAGIGCFIGHGGILPRDGAAVYGGIRR